VNSVTHTRYGTGLVECDAGLLNEDSVIVPSQHLVLTTLRTIAEQESVIATVAAIPVLVPGKSSTNHTRVLPVALADATSVEKVAGKVRGRCPEISQQSTPPTDLAQLQKPTYNRNT